MDLSIEFTSRLGVYGSAGSFGVCPFAGAAKTSESRITGKRRVFITLFASI
jgi:hypothetical protein